MENKQKINTSFGVVVIAFLVVVMFVLNDSNNKNLNSQKETVACMANLVKIKNDKIIILSKRLAEKQKEYDSLQKTLTDAKNSLDALSKKSPEAGAPAAVAAK